MAEMNEPDFKKGQRVFCAYRWYGTIVDPVEDFCGQISVMVDDAGLLCIRPDKLEAVENGERTWILMVNEESSRFEEKDFYISFATDTEFLGAVIVRALGTATALAVSHALGINPGGGAAIIEIPGHVTIDGKWRDRLLSREDIAAMDAEMAGGGSDG